MSSIFRNMKIFQENLRRENLCQFFLSLFLFLLPWQTIYIIKEQFLNGSKWQYGTIGFFATEIILWILFFCFFIWILKAKKIFGKDNFHWNLDRLFLFSLLLFLLYTFSSFFWAKVSGVAFAHSFFILEAILLFIFLLFFPFSWRDSVKWFIIGAWIQSFLGLWQFFTQSTFPSKWLGLALHLLFEPGTSVVVGENIGRVLRSYGAFAHPNIFGGYLVCAIVLTTLFLWQEKKQKIWWYGGLALEITALFFTFSRSSWIAAAVWFIGFFFFWIFTRKNWKLSLNFIPKVTILFVSLTFVLSIAHLGLVSNRVAQSSSHEIRSTQERLSGIEEALTLWKQHAIFGVGSGNYTAAAYEMNPKKAGYEYQPVHNVPLLLLCEFGLIGILLICFVFFRLLKLIFSSKQSEKRIFIPLLALILAIYACLGLFDHYLVSSYSGLIFGIVFLGLSLRFLTQFFPRLSSK